MSTDLATLGIKIESGDIKKAVRELDRLERQSKDNVKQNKQLGGSFKVLGGIVAGIGIGAMAKSVITTAASFEKLEASLVTVTGSAENAVIAMEGITTFATETPYQVEEITGAFIKLSALGIKPTEENLRSFGNTSSAMGKSLNQMIEAVADAATGEFERLKEFGIKARSQGDDVSFTFQGVTTTVKKNAKEITGYLEGIGQTQFAGAMEKQMDTLDGAFSNFNDSVSLAIKKLSEDSGFNQLVKDATKGLALFIRELTGTEGLDDVSTRIEATTKEIEKFKQQIQEAEESRNKDKGFLDYIIGSSPDAVIANAQAQIQILSGQLEVFQKRADELKTKSGLGDLGGGGTADPSLSAGQSSALEKLQEQYKSEEQLLYDKYTKEQELLTLALEAKELTREEYRNLQFESEIAMFEKQEELADKSIELTRKEEEAKRALRTRGVKYAGAIADNLAVLMTSKSKELFEIGKAAAIASSTINTYQAITRTMAEMPYPWNIPLAIAQGVAGFAQVANIKSQSFGGSGGGGVGSIGGGGATTGFSGGGAIPGPIPAPQEQIQPVQKTINVVVEGDGPNTEAMRNFIMSLEETASNMGSDTRLVLS